VLPVFTVEVVLLALVSVREDVVGGVDLLEDRFGGLVAGVDVGVVLAGKAAVSGPDFFVGRLAADAQDFVIIPCHEA
jgi:hypothetical protein